MSVLRGLKYRLGGKELEETLEMSPEGVVDFLDGLETAQVADTRVYFDMHGAEKKNALEDIANDHYEVLDDGKVRMNGGQAADYVSDMFDSKTVTNYVVDVVRDGDQREVHIDLDYRRQPGGDVGSEMYEGDLFVSAPVNDEDIAAYMG